MKRRKIIITSLVFLALLFTVIGIIEINSKYEKLTKNEIENLRVNYPLYSGSPDGFFVTSEYVPIDTVVDLSDTFVYCEVIGNVYYSRYEMSTGDTEFDEKLESYGAGLEVTKFYYPVKVIKDTEGLLSEGFEFSYSCSSVYYDLMPQPDIGDKLIIPLHLYKRDNGEVMYETGNQAVFYVTDKEYVLAAFKSDADEKYSGLKAENVMNVLKKTAEQKEEWIAKNQDVIDLYRTEIESKITE